MAWLGNSQQESLNIVAMETALVTKRRTQAAYRRPELSLPSAPGENEAQQAGTEGHRVLYRVTKPPLIQREICENAAMENSVYPQAYANYVHGRSLAAIFL